MEKKVSSHSQEVNQSGGENQKKKKRVYYKKKFLQKDRAIKIIKELSEFLRMLDLRESDILKTMLVRFAIESVEATAGSLFIFDENKNELICQDTYVYENNRILLEDFSKFIGNVVVQPGEGTVGTAMIKRVPILIEDVRNMIPRPSIEKIVGRKVKSLMAIPIIVNDEVVAVLELANDSKKRFFTPDDLEIAMIIANFASATLENAQLFEWAIHDSLTGLYNKHYFEKELADSMERVMRSNTRLSLVVMDIDNFKGINDTYGHKIGDEALKMLAKAIRETIRSGIDIPGRYGGDEFVICFPNAPATTAKNICERLLNKVKNTPIPLPDGSSFNITISQGISEFPTQANNSLDLFNKADVALYESKRGGKARVTIYSPEMENKEDNNGGESGNN